MELNIESFSIFFKSIYFLFSYILKENFSFKFLLFKSASSKFLERF